MKGWDFTVLTKKKVHSSVSWMLEEESKTPGQRRRTDYTTIGTDFLHQNFMHQFPLPQVPQRQPEWVQMDAHVLHYGWETLFLGNPKLLLWKVSMFALCSRVRHIAFQVYSLNKGLQRVKPKTKEVISSACRMCRNTRYQGWLSLNNIHDKERHTSVGRVYKISEETSYHIPRMF